MGILESSFFFGLGLGFNSFGDMGFVISALLVDCLVLIVIFFSVDFGFNNFSLHKRKKRKEKKIPKNVKKKLKNKCENKYEQVSTNFSAIFKGFSADADKKSFVFEGFFVISVSALVQSSITELFEGVFISFGLFLFFSFLFLHGLFLLLN